MLGEHTNQDPAPLGKLGLGRSYTFDTFRVGPSNERAYDAALKVADLRDDFSPVLIHSSGPYGKSHLLMATITRLRATKPDDLILFYSSKEFIEQTEHRNIDTVIEKLIKARAVIIDDIHLLNASMSSSSRILRELISHGVCVLVSSAYAPENLTDFDPGLRSEFSRGIVCEISQPDESLQREILQTLGPRTSLSRDRRRITVDEIQKTVAEYYELKQADLLSERRPRSIARPRQVAMWLCRELTTRSLPDIGKRFGGRDHTTVIHAKNKINDLMIRDPKIVADIEALTQLLQ